MTSHRLIDSLPSVLVSNDSEMIVLAFPDGLCICVSLGAKVVTFAKGKARGFFFFLIGTESLFVGNVDELTGRTEGSLLVTEEFGDLAEKAVWNW